MSLRWICSIAMMIAAWPAFAFDPWTESAQYEFDYTVDLASIDAEPGQTVELWIPLPTESLDQTRLRGSIESPFPVSETVDRLGNRIAHLRWQGRAPEGATLVARAVIERAPSTGLSKASVVPDSRDDASLYLGARRKVPLDGLIEQLGVQESRGIKKDGEKIRAFYDYVVKTMRYAKDGEGWGRGDALWACTSKYGNCTDFHSLFLGMSRSQSIPARFVMGFPINPAETSGSIGGYHCWAEAWDREQGWIPMDASEAWKAKRIDDYFGHLPADRIAFTMGRDLVLEPPQQGEPLNYFIYPYAEVAGEIPEKVTASFSYRRVEAEHSKR